MPGFIQQLGEQMGTAGATGLLGAGMGLILEGHQDKRQLRQQGKLQNLQMEGQRGMVDYNYQKQMEMWKNTNYEAQMEQLKKAGLNPGLIYGMGGGGGATTGQATGNVTGAQAPQGGGEIMGMTTHAIQLGLMKAQKENIEADTKKKEVEAAKTEGVDTLKTQTETQSLEQGIENQKAQEKLTRVQEELAQVNASVARQTINEQMAAWENIVKKGTEEINLLHRENALSEIQMQDKIKLLKNQVAESSIRGALMNAQKTNTQQDTKNKVQEILESDARIKAMAQQLMIAWDKLSLDTAGNRRAEQEYLDRELDDFKFIKDLVPGFLIPIGKGFGGGHKPVTGFR